MPTQFAVHKSVHFTNKTFYKMPLEKNLMKNHRVFLKQSVFYVVLCCFNNFYLVYKQVFYMGRILISYCQIPLYNHFFHF